MKQDEIVVLYHKISFYSVECCNRLKYSVISFGLTVKIILNGYTMTPVTRVISFISSIPDKWPFMFMRTFWFWLQIMRWPWIIWRHDTLHHNIWLNDTQCQNKYNYCITVLQWNSATKAILNVGYRYVECRNETRWCHYAECRGAVTFGQEWSFSSIRRYQCYKTFFGLIYAKIA